MPSYMKMISVKDIDKYRYDGGILIDIRKKDEYLKGHIPGAINIEYDDFIANINILKSYLYIIVYCDYGNMGYRLVKQLYEDYGVDNVLNVYGGYNAYRGNVEN